MWQLWRSFLQLKRIPAEDELSASSQNLIWWTEGVEQAVVSILNGHSRRMKLGWHIIRNPDQNELRDAHLDRDQLESIFFRSQSPWNGIDKANVGIDFAMSSEGHPLVVDQEGIS